MIGNVWEWTTDWYTQKARGRCAKKACLHSGEPAPAASRPLATIPASPNIKIPRKVIKGRPPISARQIILPALSSRRAPTPKQWTHQTSHVGFSLCGSKHEVKRRQNGTLPRPIAFRPSVRDDGPTPPLVGDEMISLYSCVYQIAKQNIFSEGGLGQEIV